MPTSARTSDTKLRLTPVQPFDFEQSLAFLRGFAPCSGDHRCATGRLTTGGYAAEVPFVAHVEVEDDTLAVAVGWLADAGPLDAVDSWLRGFLSLDDALSGLYAAARDDPPFRRIVDDLYGYHHVRFTKPFEAACWAAISQRTPMAVSRRLKRALVEACGRLVDADGEAVALFPTPARVLADPDAVKAAVDHDRKSKTLLAAAAAFVDEDLAALDDEALRERLGAIWGFGEWSSEFVALRGFGRLSGLPRTERRLREAVASIYDLSVDEADDAALDRLSEPYAPVEGYWAHYIRVWAFRHGDE